MTTHEGEPGGGTAEPDGEVIDLTSPTPIAPGGATSRGARMVAVVAGIALVAGGLVFALSQSGGSESTAEQAVRDLFTAIGNEDVLGALATLDEGERDALADPVGRLSDQLQRLEVLGPGFDLEHIGGIDLTFEGLEFRSEPVRDDLTRVYLTGGSATFSYDTDQLPIGAWTEGVLDNWDIDYRGRTGTDRSDLTTAGSSDDFLVAHRGADGWRVSIGYTIVEMARSSYGSAPVPAPGTGLEPIGADSPEAAVEELVRAAARFDLAGAVARLSPLEFGAVQDYWELLVPDGAVPSADDIGFAIEIEAIEASSTVSGDRATVTVTGVDAELTRHGEDGFTIGVSVHDGCLTVDGDFESLGGFGLDPEMFSDGPVCADDLASMMEADDSGMFDSFSPADFGIIAQRVDGEWYAAPISTLLDLLATGAEALDRATLDSIAEIVESFTMGFSGEMRGISADPYGMDGMDGFEGFDGMDGMDGMDGFDEPFEVELEERDQPTSGG